MALGQLSGFDPGDHKREAEQNTGDEKNAVDSCPLIVLDGITTTDGDFIDIGKPVSLDSNGIARTVPVVLKTLVFGNP